MSSPDTRGRHPVAHVERTLDPAVLRWVVHEPALPPVPARLAPPVGSPLAAEGTAVRRAGGDLFVRVADADTWVRLAAVADASLRDALAAGAAWLFTADAVDECDADWTAAVRSPSEAGSHGCSGCSHARGCGAVAVPVSRRAGRVG